MLYFAYGSNLDAPQMIDRCPSAVMVATGTLNGYRLTFSGWSHGRNGGVANVRRSKKGGKVRGILWEISAEDLRTLDAYEGYPTQYDRKRRIVVDRHGRRRKAWVYYMTGRRDDARPSMNYYTLIAAAYQVLGFSQRKLTAALLAAPVRKAPIRALRRFPALALPDDLDQAWIDWIDSEKTG